MKIALIFLLAFVSLSYQQRFVYRQPFYQPSPIARFHYRFPLDYYGRPLVSNDIYGLNDEDGVGQGPVNQLEGRAKIPSSENRLFMSAFNWLNLLTSTSLVTATSTLTVASVQSCIGSTQFAVTVVGGVSKSSTAACSRRRRDAEAVDSLLEVPEEVQPTQVLPMEATAMLKRETTDFEPEIQSSRSSFNWQANGRARLPRMLSTVTLTITQYSLFTTPVIKSYTLAASTQLSCLPAGYTVC